MEAVREIRSWADGVHPQYRSGLFGRTRPGARHGSRFGVSRVPDWDHQLASLTQEEAISMFERGTLKEWVQTQIAIDLLKGG